MTQKKIEVYILRISIAIRCNVFTHTIVYDHPYPALLYFDCLPIYYLLIIAIPDSTFLYNNIHLC